ncbi:hypothetical protein G5714_004627 [Onychostoma macrolepis]|uniref:Uncharacterized protein n=1 Tax=Onychostoma macrolepis TaxID=369639 RepID=A0A7J6D607_9TELE|nr:hypothetical protein G5714_004627 [Onychostoma macrolepis]
MSEASRKRTERMKSRDDQHRHAEAAEALLDLHESAENTEEEDNTEMLRDQQDAECQTDLTVDDIERMEDVLKHTTDLRTKALDTQFSQESFQKNEDLAKFYTGLPNFLVLMQKNQYNILDGPLPLRLVKSMKDERDNRAEAIIDRIVHVYRALMNMSGSVMYNRD